MPRNTGEMAMNIKITLVETNYLTRWPCTVCGGCTEKVPILAESEYTEGECIRVCERCLEAGDIDSRLRKNAASLRAYADCVESLVGQLIVPTYEQWEAACERHEDEFGRMRRLGAIRDGEARVFDGEDPLPF
jgi:hypothetical protein